MMDFAAETFAETFASSALRTLVTGVGGSIEFSRLKKKEKYLLCKFTPSW